MRSSGAPWAGFVYPDLEDGFKDGAKAPERSFIRLSTAVTDLEKMSVRVTHLVFLSNFSIHSRLSS